MTFFRTAALSLAAILFAACGEETPAPAPIRDAIAIRYVGEDEVQLHAEPNEQSPVVATFMFGESASVLADQGDWSEIRLDVDRSAWAPRATLLDEPPGAGLDTGGDASAGGSPTPRFRVPPSPIFSGGGARGEIVFEASVNAAGEITDVRTISNTTGNPALEAQNREELRKARFFPLKVGGISKPFVYEHRVTY